MNESMTYSINIFNRMLTGDIEIPYKGIKYILYQHLIIWGCATREITGLLLQLSYNMLCARRPDRTPRTLNAKILNDFISYQLKTGNISRESVKGTNLYSITSKGIQELAAFHESNEKISREYICLLKHFLIRKNDNHSIHSANISLIFLHMAFGIRCSIDSFCLNTPVNANGRLLTSSFSQNRNHFKADAHLICGRPVPINMFFENDMGTEQQGTIIDKLNRYYALAFSDETALNRTCLHFTVGKYSGLTTDATASAYPLPGKYTLEQYRNMLDTMVCTASYFLENSEHENLISYCPDAVIRCGESFIENLSFCSRTFENMISYFKNMYEMLPDTKDVRRFLSPDRLPHISCRQPGIDMDRHGSAYLQRREKIFKWAETSNISGLILKGLKLTASDNDCDGTDFFRCYPCLSRSPEKSHLKAVCEYRKNSPDLSRFAGTEEVASSNCEYDNMRFFKYRGGSFPLANCCQTEINGREMLFCFEHISDDYSARVRIENYLKLGAPTKKNMLLYICYDDDIFSLKYVEKLKGLYSDMLNTDRVKLWKTSTLSATKI